jgi:hypothetical protein
VTITTDSPGIFLGGAFMYPAADFSGGGTAVLEASPINGAAYTVGSPIPEPGTALLVLVGLGGFGLIGRNRRR